MHSLQIRRGQVLGRHLLGSSSLAASYYRRSATLMIAPVQTNSAALLTGMIGRQSMSQKRKAH